MVGNSSLIGLWKSSPSLGSVALRLVEEADGRHHQRAWDYQQPSQVLVHFLEQPVKGQCEKDVSLDGSKIAS
jgi:hypothetical protein